MAAGMAQGNAAGETVIARMDIYDVSHTNHSPCVALRSFCVYLRSMP
jgi:hypothetical protein